MNPELLPKPTFEFGRVSSKDAMKLCRLHPRDSDILITNEYDGLYAIQAPGVKAVIWEREVPAPIKAFVEELEAQKLDLFRGWQHTVMQRDLEPGRKIHEAVPREWIDDVFGMTQFLYELNEEMDPTILLIGEAGTKKPDDDFDSNRIHVDTTYTLHTGHLGAGLEIYPGRITRDGLTALQEQNADGEILPPGHLIVFNGEGPESMAQGGPLRGLPHRTPPRAKYATKGRLAVSVF